jgi:phosphoglucosamine mutase
MNTNGFVLGGEQSGHIIRKDFADWGDGIFNALSVLEIFTNRLKSNSALTSFDLLNLFTPMAQLHEKVPVLHKDKSTNSEQIAIAIDQQKSLLGPDSRIIIRPSGTEDVVRITVEGLSENDLKQSIKALTEVVVKVCA